MELQLRNTSTVDQHRPQQNALLAALSSEVCERLAQDLELVPLTLGQILYESNETMSHAYFPIDCIVSLLYVMKNGESAEIAVVGNEGMIGIALFMGGDSTMSRGIVQNAGHAYRLKAQVRWRGPGSFNITPVRLPCLIGMVWRKGLASATTSLKRRVTGCCHLPSK